MRKEVHQILSLSNKTGSYSWWTDLFLIILIILNILAIILESVVSLKQQYQAVFVKFEIFSVIVFSVEYLLRIWTANELRKFQKPVTGNIRYAFTPLAIIDLLAILPFYLSFIGVDLRFIRALRLFRIFRLFKIARYTKALIIMKEVIISKKEKLIVAVSFTLILLLFSSILMYYIENKAQPENFSSIPETMWWGIATLTTIGYGDVYPVTGLGKLMGGIVAILSIGLFALPAGILASGFTEHMNNEENYVKVCEKCNSKIKLN